ncbi:MAG: hypothetical protein P9C36_03020 [Defluviicoccus sp.]|nr:hypothetical protein [Defluviicoccus sp.]
MTMKGGTVTSRLSPLFVIRGLVPRVNDLGWHGELMAGLRRP